MDTIEFYLGDQDMHCLALYSYSVSARSGAGELAIDYVHRDALAGLIRLDYLGPFRRVR
jgi:hypothetical protein